MLKSIKKIKPPFKKKKPNLRDKITEKRVKSFLTGSDFSDFVIYLKSNRKIMWTNFLAGIFRGLGFIIGVTLVFALLVWFLAAIVDFPVIGEYAKDAKQQLTDYAEETKYKENFIEMERLLREINQKLETSKSLPITETK